MVMQVSHNKFFTQINFSIWFSKGKGQKGLEECREPGGKCNKDVECGMWEQPVKAVYIITILILIKYPNRGGMCSFLSVRLLIFFCLFIYHASLNLMCYVSFKISSQTILMCNQFILCFHKSVLHPISYMSQFPNPGS